MSKSKKKRDGDTREFTALKSTDCNKKQDGAKNKSEQMRISDRSPKPSFEV